MRTISGTVTSTKMAKTVTVTVYTYKRHPKYKKSFRITRKFYAHDENELCRDGDTVSITEHRPLSKLKRWLVTTIDNQPIETVKRGPRVKAIPEESDLDLDSELDLDTTEEEIEDQTNEDTSEPQPSQPSQSSQSS